MAILARWLLSALAISVTAYMLRGVHVHDFYAALAAAFILGIINVTIKPLLVLLTLPVTILTLGLFTFVINALMIMLSAQIVPGFSVESFGWALIFSIVLSIINYFLYQIFE
jgi:putative membrane protein